MDALFWVIQVLHAPLKIYSDPGLIVFLSWPISMLEDAFSLNRRWCAMHTLNLGIYPVALAEGLLVLTECWITKSLDAERNAEDALDQGLKEMFVRFKMWTRANRITCSMRQWKRATLHIKECDNTVFPWMLVKAFNARVVLAWLSVPRMHIGNINTQYPFMIALKPVVKQGSLPSFKDELFKEESWILGSRPGEDAALAGRRKQMASLTMGAVCLDPIQALPFLICLAGTYHKFKFWGVANSFQSHPQRGVV